MSVKMKKNLEVKKRMTTLKIKFFLQSGCIQHLVSHVVSEVVVFYLATIFAFSKLS